VRRKIGINVASNYLGVAANALVTLLLTPYLVYRLGAETFGLWVLLGSLFAYVQLFDLGASVATIRFVAFHHGRGEHEQIEATVATATRFLVAPALVALVAVWLASPRVADWFVIEGEGTDFARAAGIVGTAAVVALFSRLYDAVLRGFQRYDLANLASAVMAIGSAVAIVAVVSAGGGLVGMAWVLVAQNLCGVALAILLVVRGLGMRVRPGAGGRADLTRLFSYGRYAFLIDVAVTISYRIDAVVIGLFLPVSAITPYAIATRAAGLLEKGTYPMIDTFFPLASQLSGGEHGDGLKRLLEQGTQAATLMMTPALLVIGWYGHDLIGWWVGVDYADASYWLLLVLLPAAWCSVFESTASRILLGTGNVAFDAWVSAGAAALNLTASLVLVRPYGLAGVAAGTLVAAVLSNLAISVPYTARLVGVDARALYGRALMPAVAVSVVSLPALALVAVLVPDAFARLLCGSAVALAATAWAGRSLLRSMQPLG